MNKLLIPVSSFLSLMIDQSVNTDPSVVAAQVQPAQPSHSIDKPDLFLRLLSGRDGPTH